MQGMFSRRFVVLGTVLVTLNLALWLAAPGFALRRALVNQLFGPKMIRVEVISRTPVCGSTDCHVDRGVITSVDPTQVTLREADGRVQQIPLSSTTKVVRFGRRVSTLALAKHSHVVVTWPADGDAQEVDVEKVAVAR
jgi:hypothetical protein